MACKFDICRTAPAHTWCMFTTSTRQFWHLRSIIIRFSAFLVTLSPQPMSRATRCFLWFTHHG
jgi:hypothetical protein